MQNNALQSSATSREKETHEIISVVIPAHNESAGIGHAVQIISQVLESISVQWEIIVVDDGSRDDTYRKVCDISSQDPRIRGIRFSRNFGKEAALLAGLQYAQGNAVITIDADLQHPPALIPQMLDEWRRGSLVVDGVKRSRTTDGPLTRLRAQIFNAILSRLGGIDLDNSSDFKLLDRAIVSTIAYDLPERQRFYRGLSDWVGFTRSRVYFDVEARAAGEGKWTFWKLVELALLATISFTSAPLRMVTLLGMFTLAFGFAVGVDALWGWSQGRAVSGFATTIITLLIIGSVIMISLGIIGEYIAKIYDEIKARPAYLIEAVEGLGDVKPGRAGTAAVSAAATDSFRAKP